MAERVAYQIRDLRRQEDGGRTFWTATLVFSATERVFVNKRCGSWIYEKSDGSYAHLPVEIAQRLQAKVRPIERREQRVLCAA